MDCRGTTRELVDANESADRAIELENFLKEMDAMLGDEYQFLRIELRPNEIIPPLP